MYNFIQWLVNQLLLWSQFFYDGNKCSHKKPNYAYLEPKILEFISMIRDIFLLDCGCWISSVKQICLDWRRFHIISFLINKQMNKKNGNFKQMQDESYKWKKNKNILCISKQLALINSLFVELILKLRNETTDYRL